MKKLFVLMFIGLCSQSFCMNRDVTTNMGGAQESSALFSIEDTINEASVVKDGRGVSDGITLETLKMFLENLAPRINRVLDDIDQKNEAISMLEEENAALRGQVQKLESQLTRYRENLDSITLLIKGLRDNDLLGDAA